MSWSSPSNPPSLRAAAALAPAREAPMITMRSRLIPWCPRAQSSHATRYRSRVWLRKSFSGCLVDAERLEIPPRGLSELGLDLARGQHLLVDDHGGLRLLERGEGLAGAEERATRPGRIRRGIDRRHVHLDGVLLPARDPEALAELVGGLGDHARVPVAERALEETARLVPLPFGLEHPPLAQQRRRRLLRRREFPREALVDLQGPGPIARRLLRFGQQDHGPRQARVTRRGADEGLEVLPGVGRGARPQQRFVVLEPAIDASRIARVALGQLDVHLAGQRPLIPAAGPGGQARERDRAGVVVGELVDEPERERARVAPAALFDGDSLHAVQ